MPVPKGQIARGDKLVANKIFRFNGVQFNVGDPFDYSDAKLNASWARVIVLFNSNFLAFAPNESQANGKKDGAASINKSRGRGRPRKQAEPKQKAEIIQQKTRQAETTEQQSESKQDAEHRQQETRQAEPAQTEQASLNNTVTKRGQIQLADSE